MESGELVGALGEEVGDDALFAVPPQPVARKTHTPKSISIEKRMAAFLTQSPHYAIKRL